MIKIYEKKCNLKNSIITMGTFDGVHLGHQKLIKEVVSRAKINGTKSVVITYEKHPLETLNLITYPYILTEKKTKERLIKELGVDCIVYLKFDKEMSMMTPDDFLKNILIKEMSPKEIVFGYDTHFGVKREGDYNFLKSKEKKYGYKADIIEPLKINNEIVSSSRIRQFIKLGKIKQAQELLGRPYLLKGEVVHGKKIGRTIGFPTINISEYARYKLIPKSGVYITNAHLQGKEFLSVTNIGLSPTLKDSLIRTIEAYLIDISGNFYGEKVELEFISFIRDEEKFKDVNELILAIENDIRIAKKKYER